MEEHLKLTTDEVVQRDKKDYDSNVGEGLTISPQ